ncbi:MAG: pentapeptide repeat-containing protein [Bacillota bacterium]
MNKREALEYFYDNYAERTINRSLFAVEEYFNTHLDELIADFRASFKKMCCQVNQLQKTGKKGKIAYITYSMLRTSIADKSYVYLVEAQNEYWFCDQQIFQMEYDASWLFEFLEEAERKLQQQMNSYINPLAKTDIERITLQQAEKYNWYLIYLARYALKEVLKLEEYQNLARTQEFEVRLGEYRDLSEIVYKEDRKGKDAQKMKEWLEEKREYKYAYEVFQDLDLAEGDYIGIDLRYSDLSNSNLAASNLNHCTLLGTKFTNADLRRTDFSLAVIYEADFRNCDLRGAEFRYVLGFNGLIDKQEWKLPGFQRVDFRNADLAGANFEGANLQGAIFTGANLAGVNFKDADLTGSILPEKDLFQVELTTEQRQKIIVK